MFRSWYQKLPTNAHEEGKSAAEYTPMRTDFDELLSNERRKTSNRAERQRFSGEESRKRMSA